MLLQALSWARSRQRDWSRRLGQAQREDKASYVRLCRAQRRYPQADHHDPFAEGGDIGHG